MPEENGRYRKVMHVLAKAMQRPYLANTVSGFRFGKPGTYLIQEVKPQTGTDQCFQSWLSPEQFRNTCVAHLGVARALGGEARGISWPSFSPCYVVQVRAG